MITLEMEAPEILGEDYAKAVRAFISLVAKVADDVAAKDHKVRITVSVSSGSARLHVTPISERGDLYLEQSIVNSVINGVCRIEQDGARPEHFSNQALAN